MKSKHQHILASEYDPISKLILEHDDNPAYIPKKTRKFLIEKYCNQCAICAKIAEDLHIDHKIPVALGGKCFLENLQVLCATCNLQKSGYILDPSSYEKGYIIPIIPKNNRFFRELLLDKLENEYA